MSQRPLVATLNRFRRDQDGAVTVDWVVLVALVISLCMAIFVAMSDATDILSGKAASTMSEMSVD